MPQQSLLNFHIHFVLTQQARVRVPKRMTSSTADAGCYAGGNQMILTNLAGPMRISCLRIGEDPFRINGFDGRFGDPGALILSRVSFRFISDLILRCKDDVLLNRSGYNLLPEFFPHLFILPIGDVRHERHSRFFIHHIPNGDRWVWNTWSWRILKSG